MRDRLEAAISVVREAGAVARQAFKARGREEAVHFKGPQDYVSQTDLEIERLLRARLAALFPGEAFFGEEDGGGFGEAVWIADPIDGTSNFVRGIPGFCISLAFVRAGRVETGIIYDPMQDELFAAARGRGATLDGAPLAVSRVDDLARATIEAGWSTRLPLERYVAMLGRLAAAGAGIRRGGSGALGLAYVAAGRLDGYCELHINAWDVLAGLLLIEEAGGWTNDFLAGDGLTRGNPVLACTPALKDTLIAITGIS